MPRCWSSSSGSSNIKRLTAGRARIVADTFSKAERSRIMAAVRSHGNRATEANLVALLRRHGFGGWRRRQKLPGKPDFLFRKQKIALFIDGCFWHGCARHLRMPASNRAYWLSKISRNKARDKRVNRELRRRGWTVIRVWEHDLHNEARLAQRLSRALFTHGPPPVKARLPF
jgi:DNA mismatch endonuclease (patch repair protein)